MVGMSLQKHTVYENLFLFLFLFFSDIIRILFICFGMMIYSNFFFESVLVFVFVSCYLIPSDHPHPHHAHPHHPPIYYHIR